MFDNTQNTCSVQNVRINFLFKYRITVNIYFLFYFPKYVSDAIDSDSLCQFNVVKVLIHMILYSNELFQKYRHRQSFKLEKKARLVHNSPGFKIYILLTDRVL